jgi:predicted DNA-binding transcriptional regulator YafY
MRLDNMRADRLLSLLMLLQTRGKTSAPRLAAELGVSVRTIYRDMEALSTAGVPVYSERGPEGGCALLDSYRTTLTGLTEAEVRALFAISIPEPFEALGQDMKTALLKLAASLRTRQRGIETTTHQRLLLDTTGWFQAQHAAPYLSTIWRAIGEDRTLRLVIRLESFDAHIERTVMPYGLVAKAGVWHLVCAWRDQLCVYRLARLAGAQLAEETFVRPADFELAVFWKEWCTAYEANTPYFPVVARVSPALASILHYYFGERAHHILADASQPDDDGWVVVSLPFESFEAARERILGMGRAVQVIEPEALRLSVIDFARQIIAAYSASTEAAGR